MISEDLLERGLSAAADAYDVPSAAVQALRDDLAPRAVRRWHRPKLSARSWLFAAAVALAGLIVLAVAVGGGSSPGTSAGPNGAETSSAGKAAIPAPAVNAPSAGGTAAGAHAPAYSPAGPSTGKSLSRDAAGTKVVKTGEMDLQVDKGQVAHTLDQLTGIAALERGYVADSHSNEGSDPSGSVTLRVPAAAFEDAIHQVRLLHRTVTSQQVSGQDVTGQYVDLKARIGALQATRASFERLLSRATTIGDTLDVESRITDVQTQIEQLQGQLQVLDDQATYGTLTVTVDQKSAPAPAVHHRSGMSQAFHRSVDRFVNGIEAIVGVLGPLLLVLLLAGLALVVGRLGYRRLRRALV